MSDVFLSILCAFTFVLIRAYNDSNKMAPRDLIRKIEYFKECFEERFGLTCFLIVISAFSSSLLFYLTIQIIRYAFYTALTP